MCLLAVLLLLIELATSSGQCPTSSGQCPASSAECPVWTFHNSTTGLCQCGKEMSGVVKCDRDTLRIFLRLCYCMTHDEDTNTTVVGPCYLTCSAHSDHSYHSDRTFFLGTNSTRQLNQDMCGPFNRSGQLCAKCVEGYGFPVYSYSVNCIKCERSHFKVNLIKYLCIAFLPLTAFYVVVVVFKISITSGSQVGFILVSQLIGSPIVMRMLKVNSEIHSHHVKLARGVLYSIFIWNLDFFRFVWSPFCLHPEMTAVQILALDYLVAVYPLFLIFLTYLAVSLHDRYPIVVKMWRPAYRVFSCIRKEWNIRGSLVQAFATFLILSYVKMLNVSFDLLLPMHLKDLKEKVFKQKYYLLNSADLEYFGPKHLPYGILAIAMLVIFNLLPMILLLLYPCGCFQRCLNRCGVRSQLLHTFMDVFQGCYRHQPRDCRYFAGIYLGVRILVSCTFASIVIYQELVTITGYYFILLVIALEFIEPYKRSVHKRVEIFIFLGFSIFCFPTDDHHQTIMFKLKPRVVLEVIFVVIILLYGLSAVFGKMVPCQFLNSLCQRVWTFCFKRRKLQEIMQDNVSDSFMNQFNTENSRLLHFQ